MLLFILDRTIGWHKVWKIISLSHFVDGVPDRLGGAGRFMVRGTGLTPAGVNRAIDSLSKMGAIEVQGEWPRMGYRINELWKHPDLREMWELNESDYIYDHDIEDDV
ncbi:MAG: hypothetical protein AB7L36_02785 [Sphingomonadaceae bacterium]